MTIKRTIAIRFEDRFLEVEVDALDFADIPRTIEACMDGPANFRAMELAGKIADDRAKGLPSAVYVVSPDDIPVCKIGIANDPITRLIGIQNGNWHKLSIAALLWFDAGGAYEIEQLALRAARELDLHIRGEWITAKPAEACELVIKAARHAGRPAYDSATWLENWPARLLAVAEARGRADVIGRLKPRGQKSGA